MSQNTQNNTGKKFDGGKPRMELLPTAPLLGVARVLTFGAEKYEAHNWRGGFDYSRLIGAAYRHLSSYNDGEDIDPESGESHVYHALCCLMFLAEQIEKGTGTDDRYKPSGTNDDLSDRVYFRIRPRVSKSERKSR